jgi:hypothetical protein
MKREMSVNMVQSAVRLPQSLHDRLKKAGGERGMGEEIRKRLEASFNAEKVPGDQSTRELLDAISAVADETTSYYGRWSENAFAFEVLKACVNMLWSYYQPKGELAANPNPDSAADLLFGPDHSLKDISRTIVSRWISDRAKRTFAHEERRR